jgi:hypothetical protein
MERHYVFKHYWWIALLAGGAISCAAYKLGGEDRVGLIGTVIVGTLGFCYFVQRQKLAETELFYNLFTGFNKRYNDLNGALAEISDQQVSLTSAQRQTVVDYFNLCAEEYLFFKQGYIHKDAWRSWCRGMSWYLRRHPFKDIWAEEVKTESFYGLSLDVIHAGAL